MGEQIGHIGLRRERRLHTAPPAHVRRECVFALLR
jgi:hypothetical protein